MAVNALSFTPDEITAVKNVADGEVDYLDLSDNLRDKLFEYFLPQMPYGTAKARDGDPDQWIEDHLGGLVSDYNYRCFDERR